MDTPRKALDTALSAADDPPEPQGLVSYRESQHASRCAVCQHPERAEIDSAYLGWLDPARVADHYGVQLRSLRTHAAFFSLDVARGANVASLLGRLVEAKAKTIRPEDLTIEEFMGLIDRIQGIQGASTSMQAAGEAGARGTAASRQGGQTWEEMVRLRRVQT